MPSLQKRAKEALNLILQDSITSPCCPGNRSDILCSFAPLGEIASAVSQLTALVVPVRKHPLDCRVTTDTLML